MGLARQALLKGGTQHQAASYSASFAEEHASSAVSSVPGSAKSAAGTVDVQPDRNSQYQHTSSGSWAAGQTSCQRFSDMDTKLRLKSATNPNLMTLLQGLAVAVTAMKQQGDPHEQADLNG